MMLRESGLRSLQPKVNPVGYHVQYYIGSSIAFAERWAFMDSSSRFMLLWDKRITFTGGVQGQCSLGQINLDEFP
jgi:hypothetical protein